MTDQDATTTTERLTSRDWGMAAVSLLLTPLVSIVLAIYNFAKSRRSRGLLFLGVFVAQVVFLATMYTLSP